MGLGPGSVCLLVNILVEGWGLVEDRRDEAGVGSALAGTMM